MRARLLGSIVFALILAAGWDALTALVAVEATALQIVVAGACGYFFGARQAKTLSRVMPLPSRRNSVTQKVQAAPVDRKVNEA